MISTQILGTKLIFQPYLKMSIYVTSLFFKFYLPLFFFFFGESVSERTNGT